MCSQSFQYCGGRLFVGLAVSVDYGMGSPFVEVLPFCHESFHLVPQASACKHRTTVFRSLQIFDKSFDGGSQINAERLFPDKDGTFRHIPGYTASRPQCPLMPVSAVQISAMKTLRFRTGRNRDT